MAAIVINGAQWGDEGKGKATDILGGHVDFVCKPNGGNNAGHTVVVSGEKYELKLLPAVSSPPMSLPSLVMVWSSTLRLSSRKSMAWNPAVLTAHVSASALMPTS